MDDLRTKQPEELARRYFVEEKYACSEAVLLAMANHWGVSNELVPRIATPFRAGLCGTQGICGAVTGGLMAIGLQMGRDNSTENGNACVQTGKAFLHFVEEHSQALDCRTIAGADFSDAEQQAAFQRTTRGTVCADLVALCCRWLAQNVPQSI